MSEIRKAIGLLSSMVSGGEAHSDVSRQQVKAAMDELVAMERVVEEAEDYLRAKRLRLSLTVLKEIRDNNRKGEGV